MEVKNNNMTLQGLRELKRTYPFPTVYVDGLAHEVDHIDGEYIVTTKGYKFFYGDVSRKFYTKDLPDRIYKAIKFELLNCYQFGSEKLEDLMVRLSYQYQITQSAVKKINEQLTIEDMKNFNKNG